MAPFRDRTRADLWARLRGFTLTLPPLRARREDLGVLIAATLERLAGVRAARLSFSRDAARSLLSRSFPLNVRELVNLLGRALALSQDDILGAELLERDDDPASNEASESAGSPEDTDRGADAEDAPADSPRLRRRRAQLEILLDEHGGNVTEVARVLGKARPLIYKWLKQLGIEPTRFRK